MAASFITSFVVVLAALSRVAAAPTTLLPRQSGSGDVTFFAPGLGACGTTASDSDFIVAIAPAQFDALYVKLIWRKY